MSFLLPLLGTVMSIMPVPGPVITEFDAPEPAWLAGHRGVDVAAAPGAPVRAAAPGVISYSGTVAGKAVVVVSHGELRTTYEPVVGILAVGTPVREGDKIGALLPGHDTCPTELACLHWGLKRGEEYLDPRDLLTAEQVGDVRLVGEEWSPPPALVVPALDGSRPGDGVAPGSLRRPPGPVTSSFGMRFHPVLGIWALHDGTDFGLGCGSAIPSVGAGRVLATEVRRGTGLTVTVDHGGGVWSVYGHASAFRVRAGERVAAGQRLADVGSTGYSTGCHLHLTIKQGGRAVDPISVLR